MVTKLSPFTSSSTSSERRGVSGRTGGDESNTILWFIGALVLRSVVRRMLSSSGRSSSRTRRPSTKPEPQTSGGRNTGRWLFGAIALVVTGYMLRGWFGPVGQKVRRRVDETTSEIGERTEMMGKQAADRTREGGRTAAGRTEQTAEAATEQIETTSEEMSRGMEAGSEELGERIEERGEQTGERIEEAGEMESDTEGGDQKN